MDHVAPCPKCGGIIATKPSFTWWGGLLGPKLLKHVKCNACGTGYNSKTGKENTAAIVIYCLVIGGICFVLFLLIFAVIAGSRFL